MRRRRLLAAGSAAVAASLSGCIIDYDDEAGVPEGDDEASGTHVTGVEADPAPDLPVEPSVETLTATASADEPVTFRVEWRNTADTAVTLGESRSVLFVLTRSEDEAAHLLATGDGDGFGDAITYDDCWRLTDGVGMDDSYQTVTLDAGESHVGETSLYAAEECLADGAYRFETEVAVGDAGDPSDTATWGFEVAVETPTRAAVAEGY